MTDEAKPPKDAASGAPKRPRKPAAKKPAAKKPVDGTVPEKKPAARKPAAKKPAAKKPGPVAEPPVAASAVGAPVAASATEDAATQVVPPDAAATQIVPPDAAATQVMPEAPTQIVPPPAAPSSTPPAPPFAPVPRTVATSGGGEKNTTLWLVVALAAVAIVAVILVWAFVLRDTGEQFVGNWAPAEGGGGGLVVSLQEGDFTVAMYDEDLNVLGSYPAARDGDVLTFRFTDTQSGRGQMKATLTYDEDRDMLTMRLTAADAQGAAQEYVRVDALEAEVAPSPTATPTPTTTASPSPTSSPTGSPSPTPSPSGTNTALLNQQVVDGIVAIQAGINAWSSANGGLFPPPDAVASGGAVGQYVSAWPMNPFTGQAMAAGSGEGDYTYEQLNGGQSYRLVGHLADGQTYTVP
jgi:hypothetical protein